MTKYFSYVVTNKAGLPDGNSVSIQPTSNSTSVQANLSYKNNHTIYNAGIKADYNDNVANLFSGKDVTGNTTFYTNISFLSLGSRSIFYDPILACNYNDARINKIHQFMTDLYVKYKANYVQDSTAYEHAVNEYNYLAFQLRQNGPDSLKTKLMVLKQAAQAAAAKLKTYGLNEQDDVYTINRIQDDMIQQLKDSIGTIMDTMDINNNAWNSFHFGWFSGGISYTQQQFKTYDSTLAFSKRINDMSFNNVSATISFNFIKQLSERFAKWKKKTTLQSWYASGSYTVGNAVNYASLDTSKVALIHEVRGNDSVYQFQTENSVRDITGIPKQVSWSHTFAIQSTFELTHSNFMGFTTAVSTKISPFASPVYSGTIGLLFRFINSDSQQSKVNFQLFLQLNDWGDSKATGKSTWQRKVIGFNTAIPFSNLFF